MNIEIIPCELKDFEDFLNLTSQVQNLHIKKAPWNFKNPEGNIFPKEVFEGILKSENQKIFLAKVENNIVGMIDFSIRETKNISIIIKRKYLFIDTIVINENYRNMGIGKALLKKAEAFAKENSINSIELEVWSINEEALNFYKHNGFGDFALKMHKNI